MGSGCVKVPRRLGETAIKLLVSKGLYDPSRKARSVDDGVLVPVRDVEAALMELAKQGIGAEECSYELPHRRPRMDLDELRKLATDLGLWRHSYHQVGDIIVFNAKGEGELEALRKLASEYLKRLPNVKAVYAKLETVGEERTPRLVHLSGEKRTRTIVKEHGIRLAVDLKKAYYNPRLSEEHRRIAEGVKDGEVVVDMFAGVGGFCLHVAALRKALVVCNDINPHAVELMLESVLLNLGRLQGWVHILRMDARELPLALRRVKANRIIMNHPTGSLHFIETALKIAEKGAIVHLYIVSGRDEDPFNSIPKEYSERIELLGWREVLDYSPSKIIARLDFRVTQPL